MLFLKWKWPMPKKVKLLTFSRTIAKCENPPIDPQMLMRKSFMWIACQFRGFLQYIVWSSENASTLWQTFKYDLLSQKCNKSEHIEFHWNLSMHRNSPLYECWCLEHTTRMAMSFFFLEGSVNAVQVMLTLWSCSISAESSCFSSHEGLSQCCWCHTNGWLAGRGTQHSFFHSYFTSSSSIDLVSSSGSQSNHAEKESKIS